MEPELGLGKLIGVENRKVKILFSASECERLYAIESAPLKRVTFKVGDEVRSQEGTRFTVKTVKEELTVILNNDIKTEKDFLLPLVKYFDDKDTFFVSPKHLSFDGKNYQGGKNKIIEKLGYFSVSPFYKNYKKDIDISSPDLFTANGAFRTKVFNSLKGFDSLYLPGGMEDADLCYRALKAGYKGYYEPESVIYHKGSATFKKVFKI